VGPITSYDSKNGSFGAVARIARKTELTFTAADINFTDHSLTNQLATGGFFDDTDKFVTDGPFEAGVATRYLNICVADSGKQHSYNCLMPPLW
jgi:hypothetical protein